jgi:bifunctional non-homologous end joining protein LigD
MFVFDVLFEGDEDLRPYALTVRKRRLAAVLKAGGKVTAGTLLPVDEFPGDPKDMFGAVRRLGFEGMVSKRRDAPYRSGKGDTWRKTKCRPSAEVVIGGWRTEGGRFRSFLAGIWHGGKLHYAGSVGTGIRDEDIAELVRLLEPLEIADSPFGVGEVPEKTRDLHWARPELVAEIAFAELSAAGKLRQPSFKRLRPDRTPGDLQAS